MNQPKSSNHLQMLKSYFCQNNFNYLKNLENFIKNLQISQFLYLIKIQFNFYLSIIIIKNYYYYLKLCFIYHSIIKYNPIKKDLNPVIEVSYKIIQDKFSFFYLIQYLNYLETRPNQQNQQIQKIKFDSKSRFFQSQI